MKLGGCVRTVPRFDRLKVGDDGSDYVIEAYLDIRQIATRE